MLLGIDELSEEEFDKVVEFSQNTENLEKRYVVACSIISKTEGTHSIGKSRNHGLCGAGMEVLNRRETALLCPQLTEQAAKKTCHFRRMWNCPSGSSASSGWVPGMPFGNEVRGCSMSSANSESAASEFNSSSRSLAHQSFEYPAGTKFLLFSINSP